MLVLINHVDLTQVTWIGVNVSGFALLGEDQSILPHLYIYFLCLRFDVDESFI